MRKKSAKNKNEENLKMEKKIQISQDKLKQECLYQCLNNMKKEIIV